MSYRHSFKHQPPGKRLNRQNIAGRHATRRANQYQRQHAQTHEQIIQDIVGSYRSMIESDTPLSKKQYEKIFEKYPKSTIKNRVPWSSGMSWKLFFTLLVGIIGASVVAGVVAGTAQARMNTPYASSSTPTVVPRGQPMPSPPFAQQAPVAMFSPAMPSRVPAKAQQEHGRPMHAVAAKQAMRVNPYVPSVHASNAGVPSYMVPNYGAAPAAAFAVDAVDANQPRQLTPSEIDNEVEGRLTYHHFREDLHGKELERARAKVREEIRQQIMAREAPQQSGPFMGVMAQGGIVGYWNMDALLYNRISLNDLLLTLNNTREELRIAEKGAVAECRVDGFGEKECQQRVDAIEQESFVGFLQSFNPWGKAKGNAESAIQKLKVKINGIEIQVQRKLIDINNHKDRLDDEILRNISDEIISQNVIPDNKKAFDAKVKEVIAKNENELNKEKKELEQNIRVENLPELRRKVEEAKLRAVEAVQAKNVPKRIKELKAAAEAKVLQNKGFADVEPIEEAGDLNKMIKKAVEIDKKKHNDDAIKAAAAKARENAAAAAAKARENAAAAAAKARENAAAAAAKVQSNAAAAKAEEPKAKATASKTIESIQAEAAKEAERLKAEGEEKAAKILSDAKAKAEANERARIQREANAQVKAEANERARIQREANEAKKANRELPSSGTNALYAAAPLAAVAAAYGVGQLFYGNDERAACEAEVQRIIDSYLSITKDSEDLSSIIPYMDRISTNIENKYNSDCERLKELAREFFREAAGIEQQVNEKEASLNLTRAIPAQYQDLHDQLNEIQKDRLYTVIDDQVERIATIFNTIMQKNCISPPSLPSVSTVALPSTIVNTSTSQVQPRPLVPPPIKINTHVSQYPPLSPVVSPPPSPVASLSLQSQSMPPMLRELSPLVVPPNNNSNNSNNSSNNNNNSNNNGIHTQPPISSLPPSYNADEILRITKNVQRILDLLPSMRRFMKKNISNGEKSQIRELQEKLPESNIPDITLSRANEILDTLKRLVRLKHGSEGFAYMENQLGKKGGSKMKHTRKRRVHQRRTHKRV